MKVYSLRMDDAMMDRLKELGLQERKSVRQLIMEGVQLRVSRVVAARQQVKEKKEEARVAKLFARLSIDDVVRSIREDRQR